MLARGREHAATAGLASGPANATAPANATTPTAGASLDWIEADMTAFELGRRFDAILIGYNTFRHLHTRAQHEATLAAIHRHLAPGGLLALSVISPDPRTLGRAPDHRLTVAPPVHDPVEDATLLVEETIAYDHATQCTRGRFHVSYPGRPDVLVVPVDLRMLYPAELEALLHHHGFDVVVRHGDWHGAPFTSASLLQNLACRVGPPAPAAADDRAKLTT
jgi:SAM-dependent methyltransferase